jgi:uncharacterized C2H2 Zn-finger protein
MVLMNPYLYNPIQLVNPMLTNALNNNFIINNGSYHRLLPSPAHYPINSSNLHPFIYSIYSPPFVATAATATATATANVNANANISLAGATMNPSSAVVTAFLPSSHNSAANDKILSSNDAVYQRNLSKAAGQATVAKQQPIARPVLASPAVHAHYNYPVTAAMIDSQIPKYLQIPTDRAVQSSLSAQAPSATLITPLKSSVPHWPTDPSSLPHLIKPQTLEPTKTKKNKAQKPQQKALSGSEMKESLALNALTGLARSPPRDSKKRPFGSAETSMRSRSHSINSVSSVSSSSSTEYSNSYSTNEDEANASIATTDSISAGKCYRNEEERLEKHQDKKIKQNPRPTNDSFNLSRSEEDRFCRECNSLFSSVTSYKQHLKTSKSHAKPVFLCEHCGTAFQQKQTKVRHIRELHCKVLRNNLHGQRNSQNSANQSQQAIEYNLINAAMNEGGDVHMSKA